MPILFPLTVVDLTVVTLLVGVMSVSSSATDIANNEDLLSQILVRLSPKPLLRFKCVSKRWLLLISSPEFIVSHICCRGTSSPSGLLLNNDYLQTPEFHYVPLTLLNSSEFTALPYLSYLGAPRIKILQSCNGLLLCSSAYQKNDPNYELKYFDDFTQTEDDVLLPDIWHVIPTISNSCSQTRIHYSGFRFYVCNPTTMQFKTLSFPFFQYHILALNLAFDPLHSLYFKIVCVLRKNLNSYVLPLYDSKTKTWNPSPITFNAPKTIHFREAVLWRRAIHWYSSEQTSLYFHVDKECLNSMPMPWSSTYGTVNYFGESRGHLHLVISSTPLEVDVFELDIDYSGWSARYHINLDPIIVAACCMPGFSSNGSVASILRITRGEKEEESEVVVFIFGMECMVVSCNLSDGSLRRHADLVPSQEVVPDLKLVHSYTDAFPFIESLCPI